MATKWQDIEAWKTRVLGQIHDPMGYLRLFDHLPQVYMYVKAVDGRYLHVNRVVCRVLGVTNEQSILGKTDFDFFPPAIATQYAEEDGRVLESERALTDQVWLVPDSQGVPQIFSCSKIPLLARDGTVVALAGVKRPYHDTGAQDGGHGRLLKVVQFVTGHYGQDLVVADLAKKAKLSPSQLHREFIRLFGITPNQYIREVRVGVARHLLETTHQSIASIAVETGFYDQSHLTRQFKTSTGITPTQYRRSYSPLGEGSGEKT